MLFLSQCLKLFRLKSSLQIRSQIYNVKFAGLNKHLNKHLSLQQVYTECVLRGRHYDRTKDLKEIFCP